MDILPPSLQYNVLQFLPDEDAERCKMVCSQWQIMCSQIVNIDKDLDIIQRDSFKEFIRISSVFRLLRILRNSQLLDQDVCKNINSIMKYAFVTDNKPIMEFFIRKNITRILVCGKRIIMSLAKRGKWKNIEYLMAIGSHMSGKTFGKSLIFGDLDLSKRIYDLIGYSIYTNKYLLIFMARCKSEELIDWVMRIFSSRLGSVDDIICEAIKHNNLVFLNKVKGRITNAPNDYIKKYFKTALSSGKVNDIIAFEFLCKHLANPFTPDEMFDKASSNLAYHLLEWIYRNYTVSDRCAIESCELAIKSNNVKLFEASIKCDIKDYDSMCRISDRIKDTKIMKLLIDYLKKEPKTKIYKISVKKKILDRFINIFKSACFDSDLNAINDIAIELLKNQKGLIDDSIKKLKAFPNRNEKIINYLTEYEFSDNIKV